MTTILDVMRKVRTNPYTDVFTLLFWHDVWKAKVEAYNADWREQSQWVNQNVPEHRTGRNDRLHKPWLAMRAAIEEQRDRIQQLERELAEASVHIPVGW